MTDYHNVVRLLLKLLGIGLVVHGVVTLAGFLPTMVESVGSMSVGLFFAYSTPLLTTFLFGALLWAFPARVADTVVVPDSVRKKAGVVWDAKLERIGVSLLGLFLFYRATSDLVYHLAAYLAEKRYQVRMPEDFGPLLVATVVEWAIALFLILGSTGLVNALRRLRATSPN